MHKCPNEFKGAHFDNSAPFGNPTGKLIQRFDWIAFKYKLQTEYLQALEFPENMNKCYSNLEFWALPSQHTWFGKVN